MPWSVEKKKRMERLDGNLNVAASDVGDKKLSSDDSDASDESQLEEAFDSDSDLLLLNRLTHQNQFHDPGEFGYKKLSDDVQDSSDEEPPYGPREPDSLNFNPMSSEDETLPKNPTGFGHEYVFHNPVPEDKLFHKPKDNVSDSPSYLSNEMLSHSPTDIADTGKLSDDSITKDIKDQTEPLKLSSQELSFEDKVKVLRGEFKGIPGTIIKNVLQRDDVQEDLNSAISQLKSLSASEGTSSTQPQGDKVEIQARSGRTKQQGGSQTEKEIEKHKARKPENSSNCEDVNDPPVQGEQDNALSLEAKIKLLRETFKTIPSLMIKIVLQRSDVEGDLDAARKCLKDTCLSPNEAGAQVSRQKAVVTNKPIAKKPKPPVLPKKPKKSFENNLGSRKGAHGNVSTSLEIPNVEDPAGFGNVEVRERSQKKSHEFTPVKQVSNFESNITLIRGLNKSTSYETIKNFAESRTQEQVLEIAKMGDKTSALIKFEKIQDFNNAKERMEMRILEGRKVTVHRVPLSSSILVRNLASNTTHDAIEYYFSNPRIGGEITCIQYEEGNDQAVVTFTNPDVMKKILSSKSLKLNDAVLHVEKANPLTQNPTRKQHSRPEIKVDVDKDVMDFISTTDSLRELQESLREHGFKMKYSSGDSFVYIIPESVKGSAVNNEKGMKTLTDFTKKFKAIELDVDKNHWDAVIIEISKLHNEIGKDKLSVKESASKDKVTIICREDDSEELRRRLTDKIVETQRLQAMNVYEENTIDDIEKENLWLLKINAYDRKIINEYSDLQINIDEINGRITIAGPKQQCYEAIVNIYQEVSTFCEKKVSLSESVIKTLDFQEVMEGIAKEFLQLWKTKQIFSGVYTKEGNIFVIAIKKEHVDQASDLLKSLFTEVGIKVNEEAIDIIKTQKWFTFCDKVSQEFKVCVRKKDFEVCIAGFKENVSSAQEKIQKFLVDHSVSISAEEKVAVIDRTNVVGTRARDGFRGLTGSVSKGETKFQQLGLIEIATSGRVDQKEDSVEVRGAKVEGAHSQDAEQGLADSVLRDKKKLQTPGLHTSNTSATLDKKEAEIKIKEDNLMDCAHSQNNLQGLPASYLRDLKLERIRLLRDTDKRTNVNPSNVKSNASSQTMSSSASLSTGSKRMKCGNVNISWKPGNIVTEQVSVQVGSTIGKLYEVFMIPGGADFVKEITKHVTPRNHEQVIISNTGNLPCDQVILVSCCTWGSGKGEAEKKLRSIVKDCLQQASKLNARSIAFPIIGTGGLGFPYDKACQIMITEVINITFQLGPTSLNDIRFVVFDQDAKLVNAFRQEFTMAFDHTSTKKNAFGGVAVEVLQGDLTDEKTDAIVNIIATDMDLQKAGALSKDIAAVAGPAVQTECTKLGKQAAGSTVITGAGKLKAKRIIHMIPEKASVQDIQKCIENCLQTAEKSKFQSISIPACGTGAFKMSAEDSAKATFQALANVCPNLKHLKEIRIILFQAQLMPAFTSRLLEY